jgi:hypothetical protein
MAKPTAKMNRAGPHSMDTNSVGLGEGAGCLCDFGIHDFIFGAPVLSAKCHYRWFMQAAFAATAARRANYNQ